MAGRKLSLSLLFLFLLLSSLSAEPTRVLVLNSFHPDFLWTERIMQGVMKELGGRDDLELHIEYMDAKRISDEDYLKGLAAIYEMKYKECGIDIILSSDDPALDFLLAFGAILFPEVPVVFCGINDFQESRIRGRYNFTGVYESYDVEGTLKMMTKLHPNARQVAVILDSTVSGRAFRDRILRSEKALADRLEYIYLYDLNLTELERKLKEFSSDTLLLWGIYLRTGDGKFISSSESISFVRKKTNLPLYCIWDVVGQGVIGGKVTSPISQGREAARMVQDILNGRKPEDMPVRGSKLEYIFDFREMAAFDISHRNMPEDVRYVNAPVNFFNEHKDLILAASAVLVILMVIILMLLRDIRLRRAAETALLESQAQLAQKRKMDAIGLLAGGVAHDFNNILTGIISAAEILRIRWEEKDPRSMNFLNIILKSADQASSLSAKLLAFGRKSKTKSAPMDLHDIIDDTAVILKQTLNRSCKLEIKKEAKGTVLFGDASGIQNLLINLAVNASQAMDDKGTIDICTANRSLDGAYCTASAYDIAPGEYAELKVRDRGRGIPEKLLQDIFVPFFTTKGEGTGLGLAAVHGIVADHKGAIEIDSVPEKGTVFRILLPLSSDTVRTPEQKPGAGQSSGCILLVDDEKEILQVTRELLELRGYTVYCASDKEESLRAFRNNEVDLVLLDMILADTSGKEVFHELKSIRPDCPIAVVSGYAHEKDMKDLRESGLSASLKKPYSKEELYALTESLLAPG